MWKVIRILKIKLWMIIIIAAVCLSGILLYNLIHINDVDKIEILNGYIAYHSLNTPVGLTIEKDEGQRHYDSWKTNPIERIDGVMSYKVVGKYILIHQKPDSISDYKLYKYGHRNTYYWIIDTKTDKMRGPFLYEQFVDECNLLNIQLF